MGNSLENQWDTKFTKLLALSVFRCKISPDPQTPPAHITASDRVAAADQLHRPQLAVATMKRFSRHRASKRRPPRASVCLLGLAVAAEVEYVRVTCEPAAELARPLRQPRAVVQSQPMCRQPEQQFVTHPVLQSEIGQTVGRQAADEVDHVLVQVRKPRLPAVGADAAVVTAKVSGPVVQPVALELALQSVGPACCERVPVPTVSYGSRDLKSAHQPMRTPQGGALIWGFG